METNKANIYGLFDPRTYLPFYIGVTSKSINNRLSWHITEAKGRFREKGYDIIDKHLLIIEILSLGLRPIAILIEAVEFSEAAHKERHYYNHFSKMGFRLLQTTAFRYNSYLNAISKSDPLEILLRNSDLCQTNQVNS